MRVRAVIPEHACRAVRRLTLGLCAGVGVALPAPAEARTVVEIFDAAPLYATPQGQLITRGRRHVSETGRAWVVHRRGGWLAIHSSQLAAGRLGWIRQTSARELSATRMLVRVDISERRVWITRGSDLLLTARVAVGRPTSPSPVGLTSVDEVIQVPGSIYPARDYGPVIVSLRLQAHRSFAFPHGGVVAFHGSDAPNVGSASSAGCFRMSNTDVRGLARIVAAGTPVKITS